MKPFYEHAGITIYHGDCREILPHIQGESIITDVPYGVGIKYDCYEDTPANLAELISTLFPLFTDRRTTLLTCGIGNMWMWPKPDWMMSWFVPGNINSGPWGFCCWVPILAYGKCPYLSSGQGRRPDAFIRRAAASQAKLNLATLKENGHPTPKPVDAWKWLINRGSLPGETVIDCCMGSGSGLIAAKDLGRKAIGIDLSEKSCELAAKRLSQEVLDFNRVANP